jgi:hypothetical protein
MHKVMSGLVRPTKWESKIEWLARPTIVNCQTGYCQGSNSRMSISRMSRGGAPLDGMQRLRHWEEIGVLSIVYYPADSNCDLHPLLRWPD